MNQLGFHEMSQVLPLLGCCILSYVAVIQNSCRTKIDNDFSSCNSCGQKILSGNMQIVGHHMCFPAQNPVENMATPYALPWVRRGTCTPFGWVA